MEMSPYVERLREALDAAAVGGGEPVEEAARRLTRSLDSALRLTLFEVLADAAAEITSSLPSGSVTARLAGRGVDFVVEGVGSEGVSPASAPQSFRATPRAPLVSDGSLSSPGAAYSGPAVRPGVQDAPPEEGDLARITVRLPEGIKDRAETQAGRLGQSLNGWIVKTLRQATGPEDVQVDVSSGSFIDRDFPHGDAHGRLSGWI